MLKSDVAQHMSKELSASLLKHEFLNIHKEFKAERLAELNCFHDVLKFFQKCVHAQIMRLFVLTFGD